ncbi:sigma-54 dependent response regulator [Chlamydia abortus]|uniref:response regulator transcription factor n=1 Tax=Paenibacillus sp. SAFN-117 TaxID=3436860 RepID=UPI000A27B1F1|nr:sigma-54 dependent response regulator [Chlamydia abortus]
MLRILVVDDEPYIRTGIASKIGQFGGPFVVSGFAGNGMEALEWLETHHADICIADIRMPVMDGLELIQRIRQTHPRMLSIVVSSYNEFAYARQAIQLNVSDYILKPIDRAALQQALEHAAVTLDKTRMDEVSHLLLQKNDQYQDMLQRWTDYILTNRADKYPLLVVDTLNLMEGWIEGDYCLLKALSTAWIELVAAALKRPPIGENMAPMREWDMDYAVLPREKLREYFRLNAVMQMEGSILYFLDRMRKGQTSENEKIIRRIKQYIDTHYADKLNLEKLADLIPISRSYLTAMFKRSTGLTMWKYLVNVRMKKAKMLLLDHNVKVYEVANKVGYENSEHFSKLFKEYYGITPKEYRRMVEIADEEELCYD